MERTAEIRNLILRGIRKEFNDSGIATVESDGTFFAGTDIAVKETDGIGLYRITVVRHNQEKNFT